MPGIAGIIHPSAFQITDLLGAIRNKFKNQNTFEYFRYKNLELGTWQSDLGWNEAKNLWGILDGQIFNAQELRDELVKEEGYKFRSQLSEELLVNAYDAWGEAFLNRLEGPFSLAIFDERKNTLLLALDRLGQHPIYWTAQGNYWLFATHLKTLLATGIVPQTPSIDALASYFSFGFVPQDLSIIHGVNKLLPGHYVKVDLNRQVSIHQYWSLSKHMDAKLPISTEEAVQKLGKLIDQSICLALPKLESAGALLQGNLGSSSMAWFLTHHVKRDSFKTFSAAFDEPDPIELKTSIHVAEMLSISHAYTKIQPTAVIQELPEIVWQLDEPLADPYVLQTWFLAKLASQETSFLFTDLGWEEMFGGSTRYFTNYETHLKPPLAFYLAQLPHSVRDGFVLPFLSLFSKKGKFHVLRNIDINREQINYLLGSSLFKGKTLKKASPFLYKAFNPEVFTQRFHRLQSPPGSINPSLYYDAKTKLPDSTLYQYERLMSAHQVKFVTPYLNHNLVEFLASLPEEVKFQNQEPSSLLRLMMEHLCHVCPPFPERKGSFLESWRLDETFRKLFASLAKGRLEDEGIISGKWIRQQLAYPYLIPRTFRQLWAILVLEIWFRLFIDNPIDGVAAKPSIYDLLQNRD